MADEHRLSIDDPVGQNLPTFVSPRSSRVTSPVTGRQIIARIATSRAQPPVAACDTIGGCST